MTNQLPKQHTTTGEGPSIPALGGAPMYSQTSLFTERPKTDHFHREVFYVCQIFLCLSSSSFFFFLLLCVAQQAKGVARSLSAPRYRALFICESVLCLRAIAYPLWGSQKTTLRKCVCIICISHQRGVRRPRALCLMRLLLMDS